MTVPRKDENMQSPSFSKIQLKGYPYVQEKHDLNISIDELAFNSGYIKDLPGRLIESAEYLTPLRDPQFFSRTDRQLKGGKDLDFNHAYSAVTFVCAALNNPLKASLEGAGYSFPPTETHMLQSTALLSNMSMKESLKNLTPDEIAGMVGATLNLDTVMRIPHSDNVLCFGGMGGDKGYSIGGETKLFSLSTLAAFATSTNGATHKHHSYPNTSKVAGQTTLESLGARSDFIEPSEVELLFKNNNLLMTSCHNTRSLHTLSHVLRGETINHLIGPMAYTIDSQTAVSPFVSVNEKVHPETVTKAFQRIQEAGIQKYKNGAIFCGTTIMTGYEYNVDFKPLLDSSLYYNDYDAKSLIVLDEIAPPPFYSLANFMVDGQNRGNYLLKPLDFYSEETLERIDTQKLLIPNQTEHILEANRLALSGQDESKARYLAMTIGLARFVQDDVDKSEALNPETHTVNVRMLREQTAKAMYNLVNGRSFEKMTEYCNETQLLTNSRSFSSRQFSHALAQRI